MKFKTDLVYNLKVIFIICCAIVLFYFFFSNAKLCGSIAYHFAFGDNKIEGASYKTIIEKLPIEFETRFSNEFKQRGKLTSWHDSSYLYVFRESGPFQFYISYPKENHIGFLSGIYAGGKPSQNRYHLFFDVLQGGPGDVNKNVSKAVKKTLSEEDFFKNSSIRSAILLFPTKHFLEFNDTPDFVKKSLDDRVYEDPVQLRILNALPEDFSNNYIINMFPEAIERNKESSLIPQYNFHWVERSQYTNFVAAQIAQKFGLPDSEPLPLEEYKLEKVEADTRYITNIKLEDIPFPLIPLEKYDELGVEFLGSKIYAFSHHLNPNRTKKIVVLGDSFTEALGKDLALYFNEVWTFGNAALSKDNVAFIQNEFKPDYMIFLSFKGLFGVNELAVDKYIKLKEEVNNGKGK